MEQKREEIMFKIGAVFLGIMSVGFLGIEKKYILLLLFIFCLGQVIWNKRFFYDRETLFLLTGMFAYSIVTQMDVGWVLKITLLPVLFYFYGTTILICQEQSQREYRTKVIITALSIGFLLGEILNAFIWYRDGFVGGRVWGEFWTGWILPATQHVFWGLLIAGLMFYGICYWRKNKLLNTVFILGGLWSVYFSIITLSRTLVLVFVLVFIANIILYYFYHWREKTVEQHIALFLKGLLVVGILAVIVYKFNLGGFKDIMKNFRWEGGGGILHNIRFRTQLSFLKQLFKYPFGGRHMEGELYYAHNVWLDMANSGGLLPFLLIVVYTFITIWDLFKLLRKPEVSQEIKYLLVSSYISLFLYYMVEPALDASIMYWSVWMLVCGLIKGNTVEKFNIVRRDK